MKFFSKLRVEEGSPDGSAVKNPAANAGDTGSVSNWEEPTCQGAAESVCSNYWAYALDPGRGNYWARALQLLSTRAATTEAHVPRT